ncbi:MAG: hypothetical protein NTX28_05845 [Novosphingobium sp.]|nr:hypothetical protein [Novosphingobium sp.]
MNTATGHPIQKLKFEPMPVNGTVKIPRSVEWASSSNAPPSYFSIQTRIS